MRYGQTEDRQMGCMQHIMQPPRQRVELQTELCNIRIPEVETYEDTFLPEVYDISTLEDM